MLRRSFPQFCISKTVSKFSTLKRLRQPGGSSSNPASASSASSASENVSSNTPLRRDDVTKAHKFPNASADKATTTTTAAAAVKAAVAAAAAGQEETLKKQQQQQQQKKIAQEPIRPPNTSASATAAAGKILKKKKKKALLKASASASPEKRQEPPAALHKPKPEEPRKEAQKEEERKKDDDNDNNDDDDDDGGYDDKKKKKTRDDDDKKAVAPAATSSDRGAKTAMIKAFRIEDVLNACSRGDGVFARRLPQGGCQFFAWPGTPLAVASHAVASMPDTIRTVHAIFGRDKTPVDLVLDVDCPVPQEHWSMSRVRPFQKKLLDNVLSVVSEEIKAIGESIETQVVLQSPNLKKASFHVHTKLKDVAFADYNSLHGFLYRFRDKIPTVDLQIYRPNGMLRMHRCMKENHTSAIIVFQDAKWNIGFPNGIVPDAAAALHSACIREPGTFSRLLSFDTPHDAEYFNNNNNNTNNNNNYYSNNNNSRGGENGKAERPLTVLLPRTEREAVETASNWIRNGSKETDVGDWRSWIGLGINAYRVAYQFRDAATLKRPAMEELLDAWVEASKKCPTKFRPGTCEGKWSTFDINKLCKAGDNDWWPSYVRLGRMGMTNLAATEAKTGAKNTDKKERKP